MKIRLVLFVLAVIASAKSFSQTLNADPSISFGVEVGVPASQNFKYYSGLGLGGSAKIAIAVNESVAYTFSAGYISFAGKTNGGTDYPAYTLIPLKAGFRYKFPSNLYLEPQIGVTSAKEKGAATETAFTFAGNIGYIINKVVDLSARYEAMTKGGITSHFGFRAAFTIPL